MLTVQKQLIKNVTYKALKILFLEDTNVNLLRIPSLSQILSNYLTLGEQWEAPVLCTYLHTCAFGYLNT